MSVKLLFLLPLFTFMYGLASLPSDSMRVNIEDLRLTGEWVYQTNLEDALAQNYARDNYGRTISRVSNGRVVDNYGRNISRVSNGRVTDNYGRNISRVNNRNQIRMASAPSLPQPQIDVKSVNIKSK